MRIEIQQLSKLYRDAGKDLAVINQLNHVFESGKSTAIVGRSGIGKSTLLNLLAGLDQASSGRVLYAEHDLAKMNSDEQAAFRAVNVGFVFQFHHLLPEFSALENVAIPLIIAGIERNKAEQQSLEILTAVGLAERASHRPSELSGGEQQRVSVARALVNKPKVVLADEPTGNLDPASADNVSKLLLDLSSNLGSTLIIMTHSRELAALMDKAYEMHAGGNLVELNA